MKKRWLLWILAGVMSISFVACDHSEETPDKDNSNSSTPTQSETGESFNPDYGLGDYDNENEDKWWSGTDAATDSDGDDSTPGDTSGDDSATDTDGDDSTPDDTSGDDSTPDDTSGDDSTPDDTSGDDSSPDEDNSEVKGETLPY